MNNKDFHEEKYFYKEISDLIPIVCHYNATTLLTKNADLVQVIKIQGFIKKGIGENNKTLRATVREAIKKYIQDKDIAIYLHVIRDYENILPKLYEGSNDVVKFIEDEWRKKHKWNHQLVNTLYISIIKKGPTLSFFNIADFLISILPFTLKQKYNKSFQDSIKVLGQITESIRNELGIFSPKILSVIKENDILYSEPLSFYYYLTHLKSQKIKLEKYNFADFLADFQINTNFNNMLLEYNKTARYVVAYTMELTSKVKSEFLEPITQYGSQFILSEFITFVSNKKALSNVEKYKDTLRSVKNPEIAKELYIDQILDSNKGMLNDFCSSQINLILHSSDYNSLQATIEDISKKFNQLGFKIIREDFNLQATFFGNLPGNTSYNNRMNYLPTSFTGAFADIHSKRTGSYNGSKWGDPITILKTIENGYYHFNFHNQDNGNTIIVGSLGTGKTVLAHFLLAQSLKLDINMIYIDTKSKGENFINSINGKNITLEKDQDSPLQVDLLNIDNYEKKSDLMAYLLLKICAQNDLYRLNNKDYIKKFSNLVKQLINIKEYNEKINYLENFIEQYDDLTIKTNYKKFFKADFFNKFFKEDVSDLFDKSKYLRIDLSKISNNSRLFSAFLELLLIKIPKFITKKKTIVVIHDIFNTNTLQNYIPKWLDRLSESNAMLLLIQENIEDQNVYDSFADILPYFSSKLYLSNRMLDKELKHLFGLSNQEFQYIKSYSKDKRRFLLKHGEDSVFAEIVLSDLKKVLNYLS